MSEWFESWFGAAYLEVYPHRNDAEARKQVEFVVNYLSERTDYPALDIACGSGRHLQALLTSGIAAVGIDLSLTLLHEAQRRTNASPNVARADMRALPFGDGSFGLALSMFTSFGYFSSLEDHLRLLSECKRVLSPKGMFVLDYLNSEYVINNLVPHSQRETDSLVIEEQRSILGDNQRIEKVITITSKATKAQQTHRESVALFSREQLLDLLARAGLKETATFGDFEGHPFSKASPRCIVFSEPTR